jgi:plasmid stabilization system protein ParE
MHPLLKHPLLDCDVVEAALWYHLRNPIVVSRLIDSVEATLRSVAEDPLRFSVRFGEIRRAKIPAFPLSVYFTVESNGVFVLALIHGAQDIESILKSRAPSDPG